MPRLSRAGRARIFLTAMAPLTAALLWHPSSRAQTVQSQPAYIGVSVGQIRADLDCSGTSTCDRTDTAWKLFGGYHFHPNFGVQAEYTGPSKSPLAAPVGGSTLSTDFTHEALGLYGLATAREGIWSGFAKLGVVTSRTGGVARAADLPGGQREDHTRMAWGAGMGVSLGRNVEGRLEYERLRTRLLGERVDLDIVTAGLLARF